MTTEELQKLSLAENSDAPDSDSKTTPKAGIPGGLPAFLVDVFEKEGFVNAHFDEEGNLHAAKLGMSFKYSKGMVEMFREIERKETESKRSDSDTIAESDVTVYFDHPLIKGLKVFKKSELLAMTPRQLVAKIASCTPTSTMGLPWDDPKDLPRKWGSCSVDVDSVFKYKLYTEADLDKNISEEFLNSPEGWNANLAYIVPGDSGKFYSIMDIYFNPVSSNPLKFLPCRPVPTTVY